MDTTFVDLGCRRYYRTCRRSIAGAVAAFCARVGCRPAREFLFSETDFRSLVAAGLGARRDRACRTASATWSTAACRAGCARSGMNSFREYREYLFASDGERRSKASSIRSRPTSPSSSARRTISSILRECRACRSRNRAAEESAVVCASGRPAARPARSLTRSRSCCKREIRDIAGRMSGFSRPISTPTCWRRRRAANSRRPRSMKCPSNYRGIFTPKEQPARSDKVVMAEDVKSLITLPAPQPDGAVAVRGPVRRDLLPQRDDLFRRPDQDGAGRPLHAATQAGRLALHRPFGIADRHRIPDCSLSAARSTGGLRERRVVQKRPVSPANGLAAQADAGRRFFDNSACPLDGEGVSGRVLRHAASPTRSW